VSKRLFLHVGSPKTGTTFLQEVLWSQREEALEQGLLLPGASFGDHFLACMDLRERHVRVPESVGAWGRLVEATSGWDGDALISHELFAGARKRPISRAGADLDAVCDELHLVITARDLARQIPAEWQEHLKHRSTAGLAEFVRSVRERGDKSRWFWHVQGIPALVERWAQVVPRDRIHLVTVPPPGAGSDVLWGRFARTIGLDPDEFSLEVRHANSSVGAEQAELIRRLNLELGDRLEQQGAYPVLVKDELVHALLAQRPGTRLTLTHDDWAYAVERAEQMVGDLEDSGADVVGDLRDLVPQGEPPPLERYADVEAEKVLAEGIAAIAATLERYHDTRRRLREAEAAAPPLPDPDAPPVRRALVAASRRWAWADRARDAYRSHFPRSGAGDADG
jgi:hypothetical protein